MDLSWKDKMGNSENVKKNSLIIDLGNDFFLRVFLFVYGTKRQETKAKIKHMELYWTKKQRKQSTKWNIYYTVWETVCKPSIW
jgi:hypothetical protein